VIIGEIKTVSERASDIKALANKILKSSYPHHKVDYIGGLVSLDDNWIFKICCFNTRSGHTYYLDVVWPKGQDETAALAIIERSLMVELPKKAKKLESLMRD
jgi:hypothetical protein